MYLERQVGRARALLSADPKIYAHLPYVIELNDEIMRTRENGLMLSLEVTGIDGGSEARAHTEPTGNDLTGLGPAEHPRNGPQITQP